MSILRPGGSVLKTGGLSKTAFLDATTLDANGTHTLKLDASDASTGTVTFTVYNVPGDVGVPTPISIVPAQTLSGGTAAATITTPARTPGSRSPARPASGSRSRSPARS